MAVTVVELMVWAALGFAVSGSSKLLAFFLCLMFEHRPSNRKGKAPAFPRGKQVEEEEMGEMRTPLRGHAAMD